ncbi:hypothetical protein JVU11DRAFT_9177 [Chiua virens]|nr:hypothetical protein JVU11DRAFT_9177 [Chiua virens]
MDPNDGDTDGTGSRYTHFILHVLRSSNDEFKTYRARFFTNPSGKLTELLDHIFEDKRGRPIVLSWMEPRAITLVLDKVSKEMDDMKTALAWTINTTTPENLLTWTIDASIGPVVESTAPTLGRLLRVAAETTRERERNCTTVQFAYLLCLQTE